MTEENGEVPLDPTPLENEAYGWVVRFVSGKGGPDDVKALEQWAARSPAHAEAFDHASRTWNVIDPSMRDLLLKTAASPGSDTRPIRPEAGVGRRAFIGGAMAAALAGGAVSVVRPPLGLWPSWRELTADYRTRTGEQRQLTLADNISIEMNTQTSIALRPSDQSSNRIELLTGEAIVTAPKASVGVTVLAGNGRVFADGALFNVRYNNRWVCVTCLQGNVRVEQRTMELPLSAGHQVIYSEQGIERPIAVDSAVVTAWKNGVVIFDAMPIRDVITEVNRYRRGTIILTNSQLGRKRFNARFQIANIDEVVSQIEQIFGATATNLPGGITLLS